MIGYETTDVSVNNKFSIVIRYIYENEFLLKVSRLLTAKYRVNADGITYFDRASKNFAKIQE